MKLPRVIIGLWVALAGACRTPALVLRSEQIVVAPGEDRIILATIPTVEARDFTGKLLWQRAISFPSSEPTDLSGDPSQYRGRLVRIAASGSGSNVVVAGVSTTRDAAALSILRASDGVVLRTIEVPGSWMYADPQIAQLVAVSHDGAWVALPGAEELSVEPLGQGSATVLAEAGYGIEELSFDPHSLGLAVLWSGPGRGPGRPPPLLDVYQGGGGTWRRVQRIEWGSCPVWLDAGLAYRYLAPDVAADREAGLHLLKGGVDTLVWQPGEGGGGSSGCGGLTFSSDGLWLAVESGSGVQVVDTQERKVILTHTWQPPYDLQGVCARAVSANRLRLFTCAGDFLEFDLPTRTLVRERSFGPVYVGGRNLFMEGGSRSAAYDPWMSPSGTWLVISKYGRHAFYR